MRILLAIDSSAPSQAAIEEVAHRPWPSDTNICVLNVLEAGLFADSTSLAKGELASLTEMATEAAGRLVKEAAERVRTQGVTTSTAVIRGHPRMEIVDYAKRWGADFIFVGSHGRSGLTRLLLGSVARTVVRRAPCSVEVVRGRKRKDSTGMRILLATDGSSYSVAASESVARRPWPQGTEVKIISIAEITPLVVEPWYIDARLMQSVVDEQTRQAQEAVSSAERVINSAHLKSSTAMPVGAASGIILDEAEAWEADLVVVGSHGRHGLERLLIGSVSESVAIHAHCSVEVIRKKIVESAS